jgi:hypothetical protein
MNQKTVKEKLADIKKLLKEGKKLLAEPLDLTKMVKPLPRSFQRLFHPSLRLVYLNEVKSIEAPRNLLIAYNKNDGSEDDYVRVVDRVIFVAKRSNKKKEDRKKIVKVINTLNLLSDRGFITGFLAPISVLTLNHPMGTERAFFAFPALTPAGQQFVDKNKNMFEDTLMDKDGNPSL